MQQGLLARVARTTVAVALLAAPGIDGQSRRIERPKSERAPFDAAVDALGMERGVRRDQRSINTVFFVARGRMSLSGDGEAPAELDVTQAVMSMSYHLPAIRTDLSWLDADGRPVRRIRVANGELAWDEAEPGIGATATRESAADRLEQVWLTPHGALRAMVEARALDADAVQVSSAVDRTTLAMNLQGGAFRVELDGDRRPQRLLWTRAGREIEVQYSGYKDWELLDVFFPERIVQRVDGRVVADLTVTDFRSNPYLVFPVPGVARGGD
jgi:hypothetical protein